MLPEPLTTDLTPPIMDVSTQCRTSPNELLVQRLGQGDMEAFRELIEDHQDPLINYLTRLCGCRSRAEDLAQDSFIRFYRAVQKNSNRQWQIRAYLYRIAVNLLCSQERRHKLFGQIKHVLPSSPSSAHPQDLVLRSETHKQVSQAIAQLPLRFRVPLVMREIEGWRLVDIAKCLKINEGTVKSRIFRGKQRLKSLLAAYWQGGES